MTAINNNSAGVAKTAAKNKVLGKSFSGKVISKLRNRLIKITGTVDAKEVLDIHTTAG